MAIYKCKVCAGTLEVSENQTTATCNYCGVEQTLPKLNNELIVNLYDRANHFRRNNEFDKAEKLYEQIILEDYTDSEAYWSLLLCKYGIEYVEDVKTGKRIPTVNKTQYVSIFDDANYKKAIEYADSYQKEIYERDASTINEIQKKIITISQKEDPYDIFISYKETDEQGRRTRDSVMANELYHQLANEGYKVFFSRITLEKKLGTEYEPYIFAALNSAKVMIVIGTKPEFFNAVWVRNEWSRFLNIVKDSKGSKILIPAYRDMDPYDLPEEFSHLQAQDMNKLGFVQDIIHGIKKIVKKDKPKEQIIGTVSADIGGNVAGLLRRVDLFLEESDWENAELYCERILDIDAENAEAYLRKLLIDYKLKTKSQLKTLDSPFSNNNNYIRVLRFGSDKLGKELKEFNKQIEELNYGKKYDTAIELIQAKQYSQAINILKQIKEYRDSSKRIEFCNEKIKEEKDKQIREQEILKEKNTVKFESEFSKKKFFYYHLLTMSKFTIIPLVIGAVFISIFMLQYYTVSFSILMGLITPFGLYPITPIVVAVDMSMNYANKLNYTGVHTVSFYDKIEYINYKTNKTVFVIYYNQVHKIVVNKGYIEVHTAPTYREVFYIDIKFVDSKTLERLKDKLRELKLNVNWKKNND